MTVNKNAVPFDDARPFNLLGFRLGTPALTTRGGEGEARVLAQCVAFVIGNYSDEPVLRKTREEVRELARESPVYPDFEMLR